MFDVLSNFGIVQWVSKVDGFSFDTTPEGKVGYLWVCVGGSNLTSTVGKLRGTYTTVCMMGYSLGLMGILCPFMTHTLHIKP